MTREEHAKKIQEIIDNQNDTGIVSKLLNELSEDYETVTTEGEKTQALCEDLQTKNENLRSTNMEFMLKLGEQRANKQSNANPSSDDTPADEEITLDKLFNAKGELQ